MISNHECSKDLNSPEFFLIALWPDNTTTVLFYAIEPSAVDVFWDLDEEADPLAAKLFCLIDEDGGNGWKYDIRCTRNDDGSLELLSHDYEIVGLQWPDNIQEQAYECLGNRNRETEYVQDGHAYLVRSDSCCNDGDHEASDISKG